MCVLKSAKYYRVIVHKNS